LGPKVSLDSLEQSTSLNYKGKQDEKKRQRRFKKNSKGKKIQKLEKHTSELPIVLHFTNPVVIVCHFHKEEVHDCMLLLQHPAKQVLHHPLA